MPQIRKWLRTSTKLKNTLRTTISHQFPKPLKSTPGNHLHKSLNQIDDGDGRIIIIPDEIRGKIDERIKEILRGDNLNNNETEFVSFIDNESIKNNIIDNNANERICQANAKRTKSKLWYFRTRTCHDYQETLTQDIYGREIKKCIQYQQNER